MKKINIAELNNILDSDSDFVKKINAISQTLKSVIGAELCTIFIYDPICKSFWSAHIEGVNYIELPDNKGIVSDIFHKKGIMIINDVQNDPRFHKAIDSATGSLMKTMLTVAILNKQKNPIGVLQLLNKNLGSNKFTTEDKLIVTKLIHYISQFSERFAS